MMELEKILYEYKNVTLEMIELVNSNNFDISLLLQKREKILNSISELSIDKNELKEEIERLEIMDYDEKLQFIVKEKMIEIRKDIKRLKQSQQAYHKYCNFSSNPMIFTTKR